MFVPYITSSNPSKRLYRRKGGGGGGRGGGGGGGRSGGTSGGKSGGTGSSGKGSSSSKSKSSSPTVSVGGKQKKTQSYGGGGGVPAAIAAGQPFAGRIAGGGTRNHIYGTSMYGSGYPGIAGRGVAGRGFPFYFWPIAWGGLAGYGASSYLRNNEYGQPNNTSRPGGAMAAAAFQSSSTNTVFRVLADNATVADLITDVKANCSTFLNLSGTSSTPSAYGGNPSPEQVIQYYRASSIALTLDGYNNSAVFAAEGTPDTPLPGGIDTKLMNCLNQTIGLAAPLADGAGMRLAVPHLGFLGLAYVLWNMMSLI